MNKHTNNSPHLGQERWCWSQPMGSSKHGDLAEQGLPDDTMER